MSHKIQIVLPDPVAAQLHELAAGADEPPSTLAGQLVRNGVALAAKDGKVRPLRPAPGARRRRRRRASALARALRRRRRLAPGDVGRRSSRCTAATPASSQRSKTNGGPTKRTPRRSARSPYGERSSTTPARTPAKSSPSRTSSPTTPKSCARKAAASPRHGSPARRPRSGPSNSRPPPQRLQAARSLCQVRVSRPQRRGGADGVARPNYSFLRAQTLKSILFRGFARRKPWFFAGVSYNGPGERRRIAADARRTESMA